MIICTDNFTLHYSCVNCNNRLTDVSSMLSRCSNCHVLQAVKSCRLEVAFNLLFQTKNGKLMLKAFTATVVRLLHLLVDEVDFNETESILLTRCPEMTVIYMEKGCYVKDIILNKTI